MPKRPYRRRTDEERIAELQSKIAELEQRVQSEQRPDGEVLKAVPRIKKSLGRFAQLCVDHGRHDLSNSALAFLATLERQAEQIPDEMKAKMARAREMA